MKAERTLVRGLFHTCMFNKQTISVPTAIYMNESFSPYLYIKQPGIIVMVQLYIQ